MKKNKLFELKFIDNITSNTFKLNNEKTAIYFGIDPTNNFLHLGHLSQLFAIKKIQKLLNLKVYILIGDFTAKIGDPSEKSAERVLLREDFVKENTKILSKSLKKILKKIKVEAKIIKNSKWYNKNNLSWFFRHIGKFINISFLLNKKFIKERINVGISYMEFSYALLQAYDFYHLYKKYGCIFQLGGSDQWTNILSGLHLIQKKHVKDECYGITTKLLSFKNKKMSKSENNSIKISKNYKENYQLYNFLMTISDENIKLYKAYFKEENITQKEIPKLNWWNKNKKQKEQFYLIFSLFKQLFSKKVFFEITKLNYYLFYKKNYNVFKIINLFDKYIGSKKLSTNKLTTESIYLSKLLTKHNITNSNKESKILIKQKAIKINNILYSNDVLICFEKNNIKINDNNYNFLFIQKGSKSFNFLKLK